jgi:hypothetical protein
MQFYRRNLPHMQRDDTPHFITFCTKFRQILPDWARDSVLGCRLHDHERRYRLRRCDARSRSSASDAIDRRIPARNRLIGRDHEGDQRSIISRDQSQKRKHFTVWQEESFDGIVRSSENLDTKIAYILENPVRSGLVSFGKHQR